MHNEVFEVAETRINTECFLPIREGVSSFNRGCVKSFFSFLPIREGVSGIHTYIRNKLKFPPYTGGCIEMLKGTPNKMTVSSLYGRVYRIPVMKMSVIWSFLPVWEGVSFHYQRLNLQVRFPPCMGGCIICILCHFFIMHVSSLYGRVYREYYIRAHHPERFLPVREGVSDSLSDNFFAIKFPPCTGGCIDGRHLDDG